MKHLIVLALVVVSFLIPASAEAQTVQPIDVAVEMRRCLADDVALSIAPGATAPVFAYRGHEFILWPADVIASNDRNFMGFRLLSPDGTAVMVIELLGDPGQATNTTTLNAVSTCAQQSLSLAR